MPILPKERDPRLITVRRGGTLTDDHHRLLADWALSCAEHVLHLFEDRRPGDSRPRDAIGVAGDTAATNLLPGVEDINERVYFNAAVYVLYFVDQRHRVGFRYYQSGSPFEYDLVRFLYTKKRELDIMK